KTFSGSRNHSRCVLPTMENVDRTSATAKGASIAPNYLRHKMSIHSASAHDRFLRRTLCFSVVAALLFVIAHRLPAPIQEVPESPSPAPAVAPTAKPKPKQTIKPRPTAEGSE